MAHLVLRSRAKRPKVGGRKRAPHGEVVIRKGWVFQVLDVIGRNLSLYESVRVLKREYGISISEYTLKSYLENYVEVDRKLKEGLVQKQVEYKERVAARQDEAVERLIIGAQSAAEYCERMIIKLEERMKALERAGVCIDDAAYCNYAKAIKGYQERKFEIEAFIDIRRIEQRVINDMTAMVVDVLMPHIPEDKRQQVIIEMKLRIEEIVKSYEKSN